MDWCSPREKGKQNSTTLKSFGLLQTFHMCTNKHKVGHILSALFFSVVSVIPKRVIPLR